MFLHRSHSSKKISVRSSCSCTFYILGPDHNFIPVSWHTNKVPMIFHMASPFKEFCTLKIVLSREKGTFVDWDISAAHVYMPSSWLVAYAVSVREGSLVYENRIMFGRQINVHRLDLPEWLLALPLCC